MEGEVIQDSQQISEIASQLGQDATNFGKLVEEMYTLIDQNITESDSGSSAWFGPKANIFKTNINNKKVDFETAQSNIQAVADNLQGHAETWDSF